MVNRLPVTSGRSFILCPTKAKAMKQSDKPIRLEDVELVPDAMERLEGAIKHAARKPITEPAKGERRVASAKPKERPASKGRIHKGKTR